MNTQTKLPRFVMLVFFAVFAIVALLVAAYRIEQRVLADKQSIARSFATPEGIKLAVEQCDGVAKDIALMNRPITNGQLNSWLSYCLANRADADVLFIQKTAAYESR